MPTSDARSFFKEVQRSFAGLHHLDEAAKRIKRFSGGALTVAAVQMLALGLVPRVMQQFCQNLPEVSVSIHTGHATTVARWVEDQTCDVGLVSQVNNNYGLAYEHLYEVDAVCVMPADHRLARKDVITPRTWRMSLSSRCPAPNMATHWSTPILKTPVLTGTFA
ncbi:LysR substrate-binding domain-containing protein [Pseudomonas juntendi]|nr:LysR substrate-binding domain-containing protein [Pseudomonas juntendi]